jgi:hypothetical protein
LIGHIYIGFACNGIWCFLPAWQVGRCGAFFVDLTLWPFLAVFLVRSSSVGLLAFPCFVSGLLALPLCGAALTFFAAAKKDKQRKRLHPASS